MEENLIKISWLAALLLIVFALLHKFLDIGLIPGVTAISSYFHAANTCLLFGILFTLKNRS